MAVSFNVPTIFSAIDKISGTVKAMGRNVDAFAKKAEGGVARAERVFNKLTPSLSGAAKELLSFATTAAIVAGIVGGIHFSIDAIKNYETAVASFRTIVGGTDQQFSAYQKKINEVAKATRKSSIETAQAFEKIAGLNADFAETADSIGQVSKAAIILSKASKDELGNSAENLVGIMNQFNLKADQASRTINVLAAGQAVGAASITQTAESFKNFGSVAAGANISLEESVALVQTLGKFSVFGAEAGTKLRGSILKLQQAGVGYASGQFDINDALYEAKSRIDRLRTSKEKDAALTKMFGAENISTGRILLSNIEVYERFTKGVTGTNEAQKAADINANTLTNRLAELKAGWINIITSSNGASDSLSTAKTVIAFVTDNLETIVSVGTKVLIFFAAFKALIIGAKVALAVYNGIQWAWATVQAVNLALQGKTLLFLEGNTVALVAYKIATGAVTAATWLWNAALLANPITWIIIGIVALIAVIAVVVSKIEGWGEQWDSVVAFMGHSIDAFQATVKTIWLGLEHGFLNMVDAIVLAWKWAQNKMGFLSDEQYAKDKARIEEEKKARVAAIRENAIKAIDSAVKADNALEWKLKWKSDDEEQQAESGGRGLINPEATKQDAMIQRMETTQKQNVAIDIRDQTGRASVDPGNNMIPVKLSTTMGF